MPRLDFGDFLKIPAEELDMPAIRESSTLQETDDQAAAVARAPRITKEMIEDNIEETIFCTGDDLAPDAVKSQYAHLTICILRVANGFMVVGKSAPMNPENFNATLGQQLAYEDAFRQLWPLYAFATLEDNLLIEKDAQRPNPHDDGEPNSRG